MFKYPERRVELASGTSGSIHAISRFYVYATLTRLAMGHLSHRRVRQPFLGSLDTHLRGMSFKA